MNEQPQDQVQMFDYGMLDEPQVLQGPGKKFFALWYRLANPQKAKNVRFSTWRNLELGKVVRNG